MRQNHKPTSRLEVIQKALIRGELYLNGFNRWRLQEANRTAIGWTFVESEKLAKTARIEVETAKRESRVESKCIRVYEVDERTVEDNLERVRRGEHRPDLVVIQRDWVKFPKSQPVFDDLLTAGKERGCIFHIIAAIGNKRLNTAEKFHHEARRRFLFDSEPDVRPPPATSKIERNFGERLIEAGLDPKPQIAVANYFLDFAICSNECELPLRLDIEVDGRYWHEEIPGRRRRSDYRRDKILRLLGWRPIRFWTDEIEQSEQKCIQHILDEVSPEKTAEIE